MQKVRDSADGDRQQLDNLKTELLNATSDAEIHYTKALDLAVQLSDLNKVI